jgi:hypothetical protein
MLRLARTLPAATVVMLLVAPAAQARTKSPTTLAIRAAVPAAGDFSMTAFELSIGGEGSHHRKQPVHLELRNQKQKGVFALARLTPVPHHPGHFLGVLDVFHRAGAKTAAVTSRLVEPAPGPSLQPLAHSSEGYGADDDFYVRAENEHIIKEEIKEDIIELIEADRLGSADFCDPLDFETWLRGNAAITEAYIRAGEAPELATNADLDQLADDAVHELCDDIEEEQEELEYQGILSMFKYLGNSKTPPPLYQVGFIGQWSFEEDAELMLSGKFTSPFMGAGDTRHAITALKIEVPEEGSTHRSITAYVCPMQLPTALLLATTYFNDTVQCSGPGLRLNESFNFNIRTEPIPSLGMDTTLFGDQGSKALPPFSLQVPYSF